MRARYTPVVQPARSLATYEDLLKLPEDVRAEVLGGVVVVPPAPLPRHSRAQGALRSLVGLPYDDDDGRGGRRLQPGDLEAARATVTPLAESRAEDIAAIRAWARTRAQRANGPGALPDGPSGRRRLDQ